MGLAAGDGITFAAAVVCSTCELFTTAVLCWFVNYLLLLLLPAANQ